MENTFRKTATRVATVSIVLNICLAVFKLIAGILGKSTAMISDAVHSASDVLSSIVVIIGVRLASKDADEDHPYGHERMEPVAAILLAIVLFITGLGIGITAVKRLLGEPEAIVSPEKIALIAAALSIVLKEGMYWYTRHYAKKIDSSALMADAWHHRSDALSSIGALIGIGVSMAGYPAGDSIASIVIFAFISKAAYDIFRDAASKMVDKSCDEEMLEEIRQCVEENSAVRGIDLLQTRIFGNRIYVDIEIRLDGEKTIREGHAIAEDVHNRVEKAFPSIKHIMVHVNPD